MCSNAEGPGRVKELFIPYVTTGPARFPQIPTRLQREHRCHLLARPDQLHHAHGSPMDGMSPPHSSQFLGSTLGTYSALSECKLQPVQHRSAHSKVEGKLGNRWFSSDTPRQVRRAQTRGSYKNNSSVLCSSRAPIGQLWTPVEEWLFSWACLLD